MKKSAQSAMAGNGVFLILKSFMLAARCRLCLLPVAGAADRIGKIEKTRVISFAMRGFEKLYKCVARRP
jgi:hypothetical protein